MANSTYELTKTFRNIFEARQEIDALNPFFSIIVENFDIGDSENNETPIKASITIKEDSDTWHLKNI